MSTRYLSDGKSEEAGFGDQRLQIICMSRTKWEFKPERDGQQLCIYEAQFEIDCSLD